MTTAMEKAEAWLAHQRKQTHGERITYRRGTWSTTLIAVRGATAAQAVTDDAGTTVRVANADWLIVAADLTGAQAARIVPLPGDTITSDATATKAAETWRVIAEGNQPCWRWSGREQVTRRVSVMLQSREA